MPIIKQLRVSIENRVGTLAAVAKALADSGINIQAFLAGPGGSAGYLDILVSDIDRAKQVLEKERLAFTEHKVLYVELPDEPGALAALSTKLAAKNINIGWGYSVAASGAGKAGVVLSVSDPETADLIR